MAKEVKTREQALKILSSLPDNALFRVAELSTNPKATQYFTNWFLFQSVKSFLKLD